MKWRGRRESGNIVDRRGIKTAGALGGGGLVLAIIWVLLGGDPSVILDTAARGPASSQPSAASDEQKAFVGVVLADTEDVWRARFEAIGKRYEEPKLVLFQGQVDSACGRASSAVGPFYCPGDRQVFLDLDFFGLLSQKLGAQGDFARAYVVAHEIGHHVQNLLGTSGQVQRRMQGSSPAEANRLSVKLELQADCYAGIFAHEAKHSKDVLEEGDIEEAMNAAAAVGDDRLQEQAQGRVVPDSFTHGSAAQRMAWFSKGLSSGSLDQCDTFRAGV